MNGTSSTARPDWVSDRLFPFESRFLDLPPDHRMYYVDEGRGGPIGLDFARRHPERVKRLVIANTWCWPVGDDFHFKSFSFLTSSWIGHASSRSQRTDAAGEGLQVLLQVLQFVLRRHLPAAGVVHHLPQGDSCLARRASQREVSASCRA